MVPRIASIRTGFYRARARVKSRPKKKPMVAPEAILKKILRCPANFMDFTTLTTQKRDLYGVLNSEF
jgi:hypothetical protein